MANLIESPGAPLCIGIAGSSCSGKTTLLQNLAERFGDDAALVSFDDFFKGVDALGGGEDIANWETPDLFRVEEYHQAIATLRAKQSAHFAARSYESRQAGLDERTIQPRRLVIAAGFLALYLVRKDLFDIKLFIDLPEAEMVRRRLGRAALRGTTDWEDEAYMRDALIPGNREFVQPQKNIADYCIDGMHPPDEIARQVTNIIAQVNSLHRQ